MRSVRTLVGVTSVILLNTLGERGIRSNEFPEQRQNGLRIDTVLSQGPTLDDSCFGGQT